MSKYYLGTIMGSREDTNMEEDMNVLYCTAKDPVKVLDLIAKHIYSDGSDESPIYRTSSNKRISKLKDKDDWWVWPDGYMTLAYSYHVIKKATYKDLQGKIYTDNNNS